MFTSQPFATVAELAARVQEQIVESGDVALAEVLLDIVSAEVRLHGDAWPDPILAPAIAKAITIKAASRGYMNAGGYQLERGDMLTLQRSDLFADGEALSAQEIRALRVAAKVSGGMHSVPVQRDVVPSDRTGQGGGGASNDFD